MGVLACGGGDGDGVIHISYNWCLGVQVHVM